MMEQLINDLVTIFYPVFLVLCSLVAGFLIVYLRQLATKLGVETEMKIAANFMGAVFNVAAAIKGGKMNMAEGVLYLRQNLPDAIAKFGKSDTDLENIINTQLAKIEVETVAIAAPKLQELEARINSMKPVSLSGFVRR